MSHQLPEILQRVWDHPRHLRENEAAIRSQELDVWKDINSIALTAVYQSAAAGNVRCRQAVLEIEKNYALIKKKKK